MKINTVIDKNREEEILIYLHEKRDIVEKIEKLISGEDTEIIGYDGAAAIKLTGGDIFSVSVEDGKTYATTEKARLQLKHRLFVVEEMLGEDFVRINQSCLVCVGKIARFDVSVGGALMITMKNGYRDYVSRRQLKAVKERIGLKI